MLDRQADTHLTIGVTYEGFATIRQVGPLGMITLRGTHDDPSLATAVRAVTGTGLPTQRRTIRSADCDVAWMSPDELLIVVPYFGVAAATASLSTALADMHHLAVDVSDARCVFRIEGAKAGQVLAKLCPVDLDALTSDEVRRTRAAQVACAFWREGDGFTLVAFRSVAAYVRDILINAAQPGSELHG